MDLQRNSLDGSTSPYLQQHANHPVWWQEWTPAVLQAAADSNTILFVSVGYSSCHRCHVMAENTFAHPGVAGLLNRHCISIKVDREQRPDIDQYLSDFMIATNGTVSWPLNVFLSPDLKPFFSFTYAPPGTTPQSRGLIEMLPEIFTYYYQNAQRLSHFVVDWNQKHEAAPQESDPLQSISRHFDEKNGGFGSGAKTPPFSTLLFLFYLRSYAPSAHIDTMITSTLDAMACGGLQDHVNGGFFRYCTDASWNVPHFEKLLVDQAMQLWVYSMAEHSFPDRGYREVANGILRTLESDFRIGSAYGSAIDADVNGIEGAGALWTAEQLADALGADQRAIINRSYKFIELEHQPDHYHIIRTVPLSSISEEEQLLRQHMRNWSQLRQQPQLNYTILTDANCLVGVAMVIASRCLRIPRLLHRAAELFFFIDRTMRSNEKLIHSAIGEFRSPQSFARDAAAFTLLADLLYEHNFALQPYYESAYSTLKPFHTGESTWVESDNPDFFSLPASSFDYPYPSTLGLIDLVHTRHSLRSNNMQSFPRFLPGLQQDFANIARLIQHGHFFTIYTNHEISPDQMPINSIVLPGTIPQYCFEGECRNGKLPL